MANFINSIKVGETEAMILACIPHSGTPTSSTEGDVGALLMDTTNGTLYKCTSASSGVYTWVKVADGAGGGSSVEIVDGTGSRTDAVMSQAAVTNELVGKLDKLEGNTTNQLYGVNPQGTQRGYLATATSLVKYSIPMRGEDLNFKVQLSSDPESCAQKKYVDDLVSGISGGSSVPEVITMTSDPGSVTYSIQLQVGASSRYYYRRCVIVCDGLSNVDGFYLTFSNASFGAASIFRYDNMSDGSLYISASLNQLLFSPNSNASNTWMVVLDFYYDYILRQLYVNVSGGSPLSFSNG